MPSSAKVFTTADALHGYWQVDLDERDRKLTTFITPFGRYYYCRGPMGFSATGDAYCLRGDLALQGLQHCAKVVDDILLFDSTLQDHYVRVHELLQRCRSHGITLNREKFTVAAPSVSYCGYIISSDGIALDPDRVAALKDFPTPANLTDLRSFLGLVNQLAEFTPEIAETAQPLRPLLSPKRSFVWTPDHTLAFQRVKEALANPPVLAPFDPALPTYLQTDASRLYGVGYALLQDHGAGHLRLVQCGSHFLADAETRYAVIELEMLAVSWALSKCRLYLLGLPSFTIHTDHRPLVPILNSYTLDMIENPRLQRLRERMSPYVFTAVWRAGKTLRIADALSRAPVAKPTEEDNVASASATAHLRSIVTSASLQEVTTRMDADRRLTEIAAAALEDDTYGRLRDCIITGFPSHRHSLHPSLSPFWKLRDSLSVDGALVLQGARVLIPAALRRQTLAQLHASHRGIEATKRRAKQTVFWPGMEADIKTTISACEKCQYLRPSQQQEPLECDDTPSRPFESVSANFCQVAGKHFLVIVDRLSNWPAVVPCKGDTTASSTIRYFCAYFREVGVPLRLRTDGGPPFSSCEFADFTKRWGVHHIMSSPGYPQSNGHAEAAVKAVKRLILSTAPSGNLDNEAFDQGLMEIRNTPSYTGRSPAQVLFGRPLRTCVPAHPDSFKDEWQSLAEDCDRRAASRAATVARHYNQHSRPLPRLNVGQHVRVQDPVSRRWDRVGTVMGGARAREYEVKLPSGRVLRRNRRFLFPIPIPGEDVTPHLPVLPCQGSETPTSLASQAPRLSPRLRK